MENLEIYNKYKSVPENALKPFDNGKFKGTDINTMWRVKCLTEQFGVVGFGWTIKVLRTWTEQGADDEILAFAEIEMKVKLNGEWSEPFTATGGNLMTRYVKSKDYYTNNDEAFKMAITDAFGVACKYLGIGADVYWANDRTKYTDNQNTGSNSSEKKTDKEIPPQTSNEEDMTLEQAKKHKVKVIDMTGKVFEMTLEEVYTKCRSKAKELYEKGDTKTKRAIELVEAEYQRKKAEKQKELKEMLGNESKN